MERYCPGCGLPELRGPYDAPDGRYFECPACERHVMEDELEPPTRNDWEAKYGRTSRKPVGYRHS